MTLWAFSNVRHHCPEMYDALLRRLAADMGSCEPQNIANALLACARTGHELGPHSMQLAQAGLNMMPKMNQQELCNSAWALAVLGLMDMPAFGHFCLCLQRAQGITHEGLHQVCID